MNLDVDWYGGCLDEVELSRTVGVSEEGIVKGKIGGRTIAEGTVENVEVVDVSVGLFAKENMSEAVAVEKGAFHPDAVPGGDGSRR